MRTYFTSVAYVYMNIAIHSFSAVGNTFVFIYLFTSVNGRKF